MDDAMNAEALAGAEKIEGQQVEAGQQVENAAAAEQVEQQDAGTIIDEAGKTGDEKIAHPADWPEDWKERAVKAMGGDEKVAGWIKRYGSLPAALKAGFEAQQKIRTGEFKKPLNDDASDEEKAAWRKENGIPETPDKYLETIDLGGYVPGEAEKPLINDFAKVAHGLNLPPTAVSKVMQWYYSNQEKAQAEQQQIDAQYKQDAIVDLRTELGAEFRPAMTGVVNFLEGMPALKSAVMGRGPDGNIIINNPAVARELMALSKNQNPYAGLVPAGEKDQAKGAADRLKEILHIYASDPAKYQREGLEAEHMRLADAQAKARGTR